MQLRHIVLLLILLILWIIPIRFMQILVFAYVAANRMSEAVDAFTHATADGSFVLSNQQQSAFDAARKAITAMASGKPSETDAFLQAAGYGAYDPAGSYRYVRRAHPFCRRHWLLPDY